jgi:alginate O-acetyltransferase complex protein AlgI
MTSNFLVYAACAVAVWLVAMRLRSATARQWLYLIASWMFYFSWASWLIVVLLVSSLMNYALGQWLKKNITASRLWTGVGINLAFLSVFKYLPLLGKVAPAGSPLLALQRMIFPLGISFWTFQAISYLFELYREEDLDPSLLEFFLYMAFWPTVLQGPICRMSSMLPQFRQQWSVSADDLKTGMRRVAIGVFMSVLAGVLSGGLYTGAGVDALFDRTSTLRGGADVWFLILGYGFQLYFSFCGISHIMIGAARMFGIQLQENFDRPYLSTTPSVFWTRWHMSLSFWIRDFVFLPLATARRAVWWRNLSLVISFFIFGLWHVTPAQKGNVLMIVWGVYHGVLLVLHRQWQEFRKRVGFEWTGSIATGISWMLTFAAVNVGYIFFRCESVPQAIAMVKAIASPHSYRHLSLDHSYCAMVLLAAVGYFAVLGGAAALDRLGEVARSSQLSGALRNLLLALTDERWVWITPVVLVAALYFSVIFTPGKPETGPVMYALF